MAKKNIKIVHTGVDEWMATYSDMVTLLMCFFVLLYAASTPNETKFQYIFQSFNSVGKYINPFVMEEVGDGDSKSEEDGNTDVPPGTGDGTTLSTDEQMGLPGNFDDLFAWVQRTAQQSDFSDSISVSQTSSSRINIRFDNSIMFDGDSAVLKDTGKKALMSIMPGLRAISEYIKTIRVQGHTAAGLSRVNDWDLSSARACSVTKYMDYQVVVDSNKYIVEGRGPYDPIADNDTEEGRQENRRVELIITRNEAKVDETPILQDILKYDYGISNADSTDPIDRENPAGGIKSDAVEQIIAGLNDKYSEVESNYSDTDTEYVGPVYSIPVSEIPEDILLEPPPEEETEEGEEAAE